METHRHRRPHPEFGPVVKSVFRGESRSLRFPWLMCAALLGAVSAGWVGGRVGAAGMGAVPGDIKAGGAFMFVSDFGSWLAVVLGLTAAWRAISRSKVDHELGWIETLLHVRFRRGWYPLLLGVGVVAPILASYIALILAYTCGAMAAGELWSPSYFRWICGGGLYILSSGIFGIVLGMHFRDRAGGFAASILAYVVPYVITIAWVSAFGDTPPRQLHRAIFAIIPPVHQSVSFHNIAEHGIYITCGMLFIATLAKRGVRR